VVLGHFRSLSRSVSGLLPSPPAPLSPQGGGGGRGAPPPQHTHTLSADPAREGGFLLCLPPRATSSAAGEPCSVSKQIKTLFKKNERVWQAEESLNSLLQGTCHVVPFSMDVNEARAC